MWFIFYSIMEIIFSRKMQTFGSSGYLSIPKIWLDMIGVGAGDYFDITITDEGVKITPTKWRIEQDDRKA